MIKTVTIILYTIFFIARYYVGIKSINKIKDGKKYLNLLIDLVLILLILVIGEVIIKHDFNDGSLNKILKWILFIIVIFKPVNTNFKMYFDKYAPEKDKESRGTKEGAGALIGNLERLLIAILMLHGQYGAIGLVFTAKSVTRFEKISNNPSFAEYYLIGSLYSMVCVLIIYGFIIGL